MTEIAKRVLFGCCVVIAASVFFAKPLLGQRAWHQGDMWLKWGRDARESYVLGYFGDLPQITSQSHEQNSNPQVLEVDTAQMVKSITDFYTRYPEDRDIIHPRGDRAAPRGSLPPNRSTTYPFMAYTGTES